MEMFAILYTRDTVVLCEIYFARAKCNAVEVWISPKNKVSVLERHMVVYS